MNLYSKSVFLHVLAAILGLGPLSALAVVSSSHRTAIPLERFVRLLRLVGWALGAMFVTGIAIIAQTHGALGRTGWVRLSFALFVLLCGLHGLVRRSVKGMPVATPSLGLPRTVNPLLWTMCALVAAITYLMEAKPW